VTAHLILNQLLEERMILTKLKAIINKWTILPVLTPEDGIRYWQDRVIFMLLFVGLIPGFLVYLPSVVLSIKEGLWSVVFIETVLYVWTAILLFKRTISFKIRIISIVLLFYIITPKFIKEIIGIAYQELCLKVLCLCDS
jgi:hypothetical protein